MRWPDGVLSWRSPGVRVPAGLLVMLLSSGLALAKAPPAVLQFLGQAQALGSGKPLYTEQHRISGQCRDGHWVPVQGDVVYRSPQGKVIAKKTLNYQPSQFRPSFKMVDHQFGEHMQVVNHGDQRLTETLHDHSGNTEHFQQPVDSDLVVDAGFNRFIRAHWQRLTQGKTVTFAFYAPTRGKAYQFRVHQADAQQRNKINAPFVFVMEPDSLILRWTTNPVLLGYNKAHRITDYLGLTNVPRNRKDNYHAHIHYHYTALPCGSANGS